MLMNGQVSFGSSSLRGTKQSDQESIKNTLGLVAEGGVKYEKVKK
jgi:type I restriction enzyme S subunit